MIANRRGAVAAMSALLMIGVVGMAGLAVDLTRVWLVSARLKTSVDAAALVAARQIDSATRDADTRALFMANYTMNGRYPDTAAGRYLGAALVTANNIQITPVGTTQIRVTARARVGTTLFGIISPGTTDIEETTVAEREGTGLEIAIVLDQTSSMRQSAPGFASKLAAAQNAVGTLLGILYGNDDVRRNLWVSVVPFSRTVNIGTGNSAFLDVTGMPADWRQANWSGCVEARTNGDDDITDLGPTDAGGRLRPYFYESTYRRVGYVLLQSGTAIPNGSTLTAITSQARNVTAATNWDTQTRVPATGPGGIYPGYSVPLNVGANACTTANAYSAIGVNLFATASATSTTAYTVAFCRGDNDFTNPNGLGTSTGAGASFNPEHANLISAGFTGIGNLPTSSAGPNRLCASNQILPLTASRTTIQNTVNAITAPVRSGGTTIVAGMQGAWYTLSPRWQNQWPNIATNGTLGTLPLAYRTRNMTKAVIILTDGDNNWQQVYCPPGNSTSACSSRSVLASPSGTELLYNAYGRVADWNTQFPGNQINPVSQNNADPRLDSRFSAICAAMKGPAANPAMRVYVIGFEVANAAQRTMLQQCATSPAAPFYLEAPDAAALQGAFTQVANSLASLRMVE